MEINQVTENALSDLRQVCPVCGSRNTLIVRVSPLGPGSIANPHHQCEKCGHRFIAAERTPLAGMNPMIGSMNPMMGSMNPMMIQMMQMMNQMSGGMGMTPGLTPTIPQPLEEEEDDDDDDEGEGI
jgi:DNA-directed RNA polymerase subunit RPC12/RpoP